MNFIEIYWNYFKYLPPGDKDFEEDNKLLKCKHMCNISVGDGPAGCTGKSVKNLRGCEQDLFFVTYW